MKTNIKLQVTPEQLKEVQLICFSNKIYWVNTGSNFEDDTVRYIFIDIDAMALTYESTFFHKHKFEEVDASLFIRTKGSCVEEKKEIDLRNTWCYATVPNHDKLRLLGFNPEPIGACKEYYYIDEALNIHDCKYFLLGNQIRLNKQGEFEYATLNSQQSKSECQFAKYGFEKPNFECEILKEYDDHLVGAVYQNEKYFGTSWTKEGTCLQTKGFGYINMNLTPIKKPWYETCTFPCIIMADYCMPVVVKHYDDGYVYDYRDNKYCVKSWRLLRNTEIEGLKQ